MKKKTPKKVLTKADIKNSVLAKIYDVREVTLAEVSKPQRKPPPSYYKRKAAAKEKSKARLTVPPELKKQVAKFGAPAEKVMARRGGYFTAIAADALLKLGANPKTTRAKSEIKKNISWGNLRRGKYSVTIDEVMLHKKLDWKEVNRAQKAENTKAKIALIAAKIGTTPAEIKKLISKIRKEELCKVKRFKKTAKYRKFSSKKKRTISGSRRMKAIFGAMTDLLQIYGSPEALKDGNEGKWKFKDDKWQLKNSDGKWIEKIGADHWQEIPKKKRAGRKKK